MSIEIQLADALRDCSDEELVEVLKDVLKDRIPVLQELGNWAVPDHIYANARLLDSRHNGTIKSLQESKRFGFVTSPEITKALGKDLFLSVHQLERFPAGTFQAGMQISFVIMNVKGKLQAFDVMPADGNASWGYGSAAGSGGGDAWSPSGKAGGKGGDAYGKGGDAYATDAYSYQGSGGKPISLSKGGGKSAPVHAMDAWSGDSGGLAPWSGGGGKPSLPRGGGGERYEAPVKSFNTVKQFGFLLCPDLASVFGKEDIFVHSSQLLELGELTVGQVVSFEIGYDNKGMPMAVNLALGSGYVVVPGKGKGKGKDFGKDMGKGHKGKFKDNGGLPFKAKDAPSHIPVPGVSGHRYAGAVKSFNGTKKYGFVLCEELASQFGKADIFMHASQIGHLGDLTIGQVLSFTVVADDDGKAMAVEVQSEEGSSKKRGRYE